MSIGVCRGEHWPTSRNLVLERTPSVKLRVEGHEVGSSESKGMKLGVNRRKA